MTVERERKKEEEREKGREEGREKKKEKNIFLFLCILSIMISVYSPQSVNIQAPVGE